MKKRYFIIVALLIIFVLPGVSSAQTAEELQTQINALMAQIKSLQSRLTQVQGQSTAWCHNFNANLRVGDTGSEIGNLITALKKEGFEIDNLEQGDSVNATLDESTASAISGFQQKYADEILKPLNLRYGTGYLGKSTRAKLNKLYGCGIKPSPTATPTPACNVFLTCETGYTPYNTSEKDNQNCPMIKCIPSPITVPAPSVPVPSVSEQVKCLFHESKSIQECYSSAGVGCKDISACVTDVKGAKGERITWKSSCGGYAYTTMDGQNEYAEFKCILPVTTPTPISTSNQIQTPISTTPKPVTSSSTIGTSTRKFRPVDPSRCPGIIETSCTIEPANIIKVSVYDEKGGFIDTRENNNSGMAGFVNLPYGNYIVIIDAEGFEYYKASFTVCATCEETTTIFLKKSSTTTIPTPVVTPSLPALRIISPNGGEAWQIGNTQTIQWSGQTGGNIEGYAKVILRLMNENKTVGYGYEMSNLPLTTENDGYYQWVIPGSLTPGKYNIRIECADNCGNLLKTSDDSDQFFSIMAMSTVEKSCADLKTIQNYYFNACSNGSYDNVCFNKFSGEYQGCTRNSLNDCTLQNANAAQNILCSASGIPSISVLSPIGKEVFKKGSIQNIRWNSTSDIASIYIKLRKGYDTYPGPEGAVSDTIANTGSFQWTIPSTLPDGNDYSIRVVDQTGKVFNDSHFFSIVAETSGLKDVENLLASVSQAVSQLSEKIKELTR